MARGLPEVAAGGDRLATLKEFRDRLAAEIEQCNSARDVASLGRLFTDVLAQIDTISATSGLTEEDRTLDELTQRRRDRGADPAGGHRAAGR